MDPTRRYGRYDRLIGQGRFKRVYRGFDERAGIDVAWSKVSQDRNELSDAQTARAAAEMAVGLGVDHAHVIRCYRCWHDAQARVINLVTEHFTSGNLREYRARHRHLGARAVRKWARQILAGLAHLHNQSPPIVHGDLRCDKIYINGHSGEIKIGDLGLSTLLPTRFAPADLPAGVNADDQYSTAVDVFAFGLVVLELATTVRVDRSNAADWPALLERVADPGAAAFIRRCLAASPGDRPTAAELVDDPFLTVKPPPPPPPGGDRVASSAGGPASDGGASGEGRDAGARSGAASPRAAPGAASAPSAAPSTAGGDAAAPPRGDSPPPHRHPPRHHRRRRRRGRRGARRRLHLLLLGGGRGGRRQAALPPADGVAGVG